jgi:hypothetical protein
MKKALFAALFGFLLVPGYATHLTGGAITWECAPNGGYVFTLTLIRDCTGVSAPTSSQSISSNAGIIISVLPVSVKYVNPLCGATICSASTLGQGYIGAYQILTYKSAPIIFNSSPPATGWMFYWSQCCRNTTVNLMNQPNFQIISRMYPTPNWQPGQCLSASPQFDDELVTISCTGTTQVIPSPLKNQTADSIFYELKPVPISTTNYATYKSGFSYNQPLGVSIPGILDSLTLSSATGMMQFKTPLMGVYATTFSATSYTDGGRFAEINAEFPITVKPCDLPTGPCTRDSLSKPSNIQLSWLPNSDSLIDVTQAPFNQHALYKHFTANPKAGDTLRFIITATDSDTTENCLSEMMTLRATGAHMSTAPNYNSTSLCPGGSPCATLTSLNANNMFTDSLTTSALFELPITCDLLENSKFLHFNFKITTSNCPLPTSTFFDLTIAFPQQIESQPQFDTNASALLPSGNISLAWSKYQDTTNPTVTYELYHKHNNQNFTLLQTLPGINVQSYVHQNVGSGNHTYRIIAKRECSPSQTLLLNASEISFVNNLSVIDFSAGIQIYPQPMSDFIRISSANAIKDAELRLYDINGRLLIFETINQLTEHEINTARLPKGVYVLQIGNSEYTHTKRLVK